MRKEDSSLHYPTREELDRGNNHAYVAKRLEEMRVLEERNRQRLKELKRVAKMGVSAASQKLISESDSYSTSADFSTEFKDRPIEEPVSCLHFVCTYMYMYVSI